MIGLKCLALGGDAVCKKVGVDVGKEVGSGCEVAGGMALGSGGLGGMAGLGAMGGAHGSGKASQSNITMRRSAGQGAERLAQQLELKNGC